MANTQPCPIRAALFKAVGEIPPIKANATNPAFKRNGKATPYVTLDSLIAQVRPHLRKYGLDIRHVITASVAGSRRIILELYNSEGHYLNVSFEDHVITANHKEQDVGRATTYIRRLTLLSALGLAVEFDSEDDDGNTSATSKGAAPAAQADGW